MVRTIIAAALLTATSWLHAAQLGSARRVGPIGTAPAVSRAGSIFPFADGFIAFTSQLAPGNPSRFDIVATPIGRNGVVQYDKAQTLVRNASAPLAAATSTGYLLCWRSDHEVLTLSLSPSLQPRAQPMSIDNDLNITGFACNGTRCLLTLDSSVSPYEDGSMILLDSDGAVRSRSPLPRAGYATFASLASVNGGFAFFHGPSSAGLYPSGITWLDTAGNVTAETALANVYASSIVAHPSGALLIETVGGSGDAQVLARVVSPDHGIVKTAHFAVGSGYVDLVGATIGGDGTQFLIAVSRTTYMPISPSPPLPSDVGGILVTSDLQLARSWFPIAAQWGAQTSMRVSANGEEYLVAWQRSGAYTHSSVVTSDGSVSQPDGIAIVRGPAVQEPLALAASPALALPVWTSHAAELYLSAERAPAQFSRVDGAGGTADIPPLTMDIGYVHAAWNGSSFALFGSHLIDSTRPVDVTGGTIDGAGNVTQATIGQDMQTIGAWWDGAAYGVVTDPSGPAHESHHFRVAPDMTVVSDVRLGKIVLAAAGVPGRTMMVSGSSLTIVDDNDALLATVALNLPQYSTFVAASNGRDQFLLVAIAPSGASYASRFSSEGDQLDDMTAPVTTSGRPLVEAFGDRWLLVTAGAAMEYPSRKAVDLSAAGTIVAMARASSNQLVLMTSETVNVDGVPQQLLMLRDLFDGSPVRRRASR